MKKAIVIILVFIFSFFCFFSAINAVTYSKCSEIKSKAICVNSKIDGTSCIWEKRTQCIETNNNSKGTDNEYNNCSLILDRKTCNNASANGKKCKYKTIKCIDGENDGTGETYIYNINPRETQISKSNQAKKINGGSQPSTDQDWDKEVNMCQNPDVLKGFQIGGYIITICKILAPLIIIITAIYSLMKSILEDKDTKDDIYLFIKKIFVGVFVFFIPAIVNAIFSLITTQYNSGTDFSSCATCLLETKECEKLINDSTKAGECNLFGDPSNPGDFAYYLQITFDVIKYAGLVLTIVLTIIDITKALSEQDKDLNKNLAKKFFTRIVIVVILFFLPVIVELLMSIINSAYGTCGIK